MMVKGALPPTISLAIYQSTPVAKVYSALGYLVAIMLALSFAILPRSIYKPCFSISSEYALGQQSRCSKYIVAYKQEFMQPPRLRHHPMGLVLELQFLVTYNPGIEAAVTISRHHVLHLCRRNFGLRTVISDDGCRYRLC